MCSRAECDTRDAYDGPVAQRTEQGGRGGAASAASRAMCPGLRPPVLTSARSSHGKRRQRAGEGISHRRAAGDRRKTTHSAGAEARTTSPGSCALRTSLMPRRQGRGVVDGLKSAAKSALEPNIRNIIRRSREARPGCEPPGLATNGFGACDVGPAAAEQRRNARPTLSFGRRVRQRAPGRSRTRVAWEQPGRKATGRQPGRSEVDGHQDFGEGCFESVVALPGCLGSQQSDPAQALRAVQLIEAGIGDCRFRYEQVL